MPQAKRARREDVESAIAVLDELSRKEYGLPIEELLRDPNRPLSAQRMARLSGIVLKKPFARRTKVASSYTGARYGWRWNDVSKWPKGPERALLEKLRRSGSWNTIWDRNRKRTIRCTAPWSSFTGEVDHERGLFKVVALYIKDKLTKQQRKTLGEYYRVSEGPALKHGLDLAAAVFDAKVLAPVLGITGIPALAVAVTTDRHGIRLREADRSSRYA